MTNLPKKTALTHFYQKIGINFLQVLLWNSLKYECLQKAKCYCNSMLISFFMIYKALRSILGHYYKGSLISALMDIYSFLDFHVDKFAYLLRMFTFLSFLSESSQNREALS